ncbi:MAG TPA: hypothetical protein VJL28_06475 [Gemmatimonadaceae bacterium]|nr:hypothetical protein [Gemmatimonadaceae bacterium]
MSLWVATGWVALILITALAITVIYYMWTGRIDLRRLISEPSGDASMSRFQLLIFTFVVAFGLFLVIVSGDKPSFPETIPSSVLTLLGISASSYLVSKGIQFSSDDGAKHKDAGEPDGKKKKED